MNWSFRILFFLGQSDMIKMMEEENNVPFTESFVGEDVQTANRSSIVITLEKAPTFLLPERPNVVIKVL